jgi:hypothetical protein
VALASITAAGITMFATSARAHARGARAIVIALDAQPHYV